MINRNPRSGENFLAMTVDNIGFLLDRLGQDCHPLQFLRELSQNSIEAVMRTGDQGQIVWDVDWNAHDLQGVYKLCLIDTGDGMSGEEMVRFINQLSSSVSEQTFSGNYGVGAKISAATRNKQGVIYCSWKSGVGAMIHLYRDPDTNQYGLRQFERNDGTYGHYLEIDDEVKPDLIGDHGTMVVLLGNSDEQNTLKAPEGAASPSRWISKYLNTRYFRFPDNVGIRCREGWEHPRTDVDRNVLRRIMGQQEYLSKHAEASGSVALTNAAAHWWILKDELAITQNSGYIESAGHVAALYQDELYETATSRAGMSRLQNFGITFGYRWVVIYVEPLTGAKPSITTNTSRTHLLFNSEPLPWADWAAEFREQMPAELQKFVEEKAAGSAATDHTQSIRDRLKDLLDIYRVSRYKPTPTGMISIDDDNTVHSGKSGTVIGGTGATRAGKGTRPGQQDGLVGNIYSIFEKKGGSPGRNVRSDPFPHVRWVSTSNGTREFGDIEDRAAKFLADQNMLLINTDFRVFPDMIDRLLKEFDDGAGVKDVVTDAVHTWFEQALVESVMGIHALRNSKEWSVENINSALSEEALTIAVMQRYHVMFAVKRQVGSKLGSRRSSAKTA